MANQTQSSKGFWVGIMVLLLAGAILGFRAERAVTAVTSSEEISQQSGSSGATPSIQLLAKAVERDSLRAALVPSGRDPFGFPPVRVRRQTENRQETAEPEVPTVRLLMYAEDSPLVVLDVGGTQSDRLHVGESFRGWTVAEILAKTVTVTKDDEVLVLSSP